MLQSDPTDKRPKRRFHRSSRGRMAAGVCAGLAESTPLPAWLWRVIFVLGSFLPGPGLVASLILWALLPLEK